MTTWSASVTSDKFRLNMFVIIFSESAVNTSLFDFYIDLYPFVLPPNFELVPTF